MIFITRGKVSIFSIFILGLTTFLMYASYQVKFGQDISQPTHSNSTIDEIVSRKVVLTQATATEKPTNNSSPKPFVYLTQTEQCLPSNFASSSEIGDPETCNCDVIVLSFRTKCQVQKSPHITYLFYPNTGWGTGRNVLYFAAITRSPKYHYYIFMDEDVVLHFHSIAPPQMKRLPPFRVFEQWLLDYEPAVGIVNYKSIEHLFPYRTQYESKSWWSSQYYMFSAVELIFRGQALMFVPVIAGNPKHRPYPRSIENENTRWRDYIDTIRQEAPLIYRNQTLFEDFRQNLEGYVDNSTTYCMNVTRRQQIKPYSHFDF